MKSLQSLPARYREFLRFCIVGGLCTAIDAGIYYIMYNWMHVPYQAALVCGYLLSLLVNYLLTIYWTFQTKPNRLNAFGIVLAHLVNLFLVRMSLMWLFVTCLGLSENVAFLPTLAISVVVNFFLVRLAVRLSR